MELLFAPLEGLTYPEYRLAHRHFFPGLTAVYAPFLTPTSAGDYKAGFLRKKLPELDAWLPVVPQLLCNDSASFCSTAHILEDLGAKEINLNAGCPAGTVFSKYKGAGMLRDPDTLRRFLDGIFSDGISHISIKTRMGVHSTEEFSVLLKIYNQYPLEKLIIHARDRDGQYQSVPDWNRYTEALSCATFPVIYNGDIFSVSDSAALMKKAPATAGIMLGRGILANPALARMIQGGSPLQRAELNSFHDALLNAYLTSGLGQRITMERMKALWFYMGWLFPDEERLRKRIVKAKNLAEYKDATSELLTQGDFHGDGVFHPPV